MRLILKLQNFERIGREGNSSMMMMSTLTSQHSFHTSLTSRHKEGKFENYYYYIFYYKENEAFYCFFLQFATRRKSAEICEEQLLRGLERINLNIPPFISFYCLNIFLSCLSSKTNDRNGPTGNFPPLEGDSARNW